MSAAQRSRLCPVSAMQIRTGDSSSEGGAAVGDGDLPAVKDFAALDIHELAAAYDQIGEGAAGCDRHQPWGAFGPGFQ